MFRASDVGLPKETCGAVNEFCDRRADARVFESCFDLRQSIGPVTKQSALSKSSGGERLTILWAAPP